MARLIVTRPEPKASQTAALLAARGHAAMAYPLTRLEALQAPLPATQCQAVLATSANALGFAAPDILDHLQSLPLYCVGAKTAELALNLGFKVETIAENAEQLLPLLPDKHFAYLCSRHRAPLLEHALPRLTPIETYHAPLIPADDLQRLDETKIDGVLFYSARASKAWAALGLNADHYFCMSDTIAQSLPNAQKNKAMVAIRPDEAHLLSLIDKIFPPIDPLDKDKSETVG